MKNIIKSLFGVMMAVVMIFGFVSTAQAGVTHTVYGIVNGGNASSPYKIYVVARPTQVLTGTLVNNNGSYAYLNNIGNLSSAWSAGEDTVAIAWKEDNTGLINHKGYYSVMNEALTTTAPQRFADSTIREIPLPTATANAGSGGINISWTAATQDQYENPPTISGSNGNTAATNIIGYNVYRSTNGIAFTKINSSVVAGTSYSDASGVDGTTYYYAIEIVYKGGVVAGSGTPILSANSNSVVDPTNPVVPSVTLYYPNGGETFTVGGYTNITWGSSNMTNVKIEYSTNGSSGPWTVITSSTPASSGSYSWNPIPDAVSTTVRIRISDASDPLITDVSNANFEIKAAPIAKTITVSSPNGGEVWLSGSKPTVTWVSTGTISNVKIDLSVNSGTSWTNLVSSVSNSGGSYTFASPLSVASTVSSCRIRVSDVSDSTVKDMSDSDFTIQVATSPTLLSVDPTSGKQGETLASVSITGANTTFNSSSTVSFGAGITTGTLEAVSATNLVVYGVSIASGATVGSRTVSVTTGTQTVSAELFSVVSSGTSEPTIESVVIDDFEGTNVEYPAGYYSFGPSEAQKPVLTLSSGDKYQGTNALKTVYSAADLPENGWRGWGAVLKESKNISSMKNITFYMKGDGSSNKVKIQVKDADGDNFAIADADAIETSNTSWKAYSIPLSKISEKVVSGGVGDGVLDLTQIAQYQFVFTGSGASSGVMIDYVVALTGTGETPTAEANPMITIVTPATVEIGATLNISGLNFGTSGSLVFEGQGIQTVLSSTATGEARKISTWDVDKILLTVPSMTTGTKRVKLVRADGKESNSVEITVTAQTVEATSASYNYPNPFNPKAGQNTKIVFAPQGSANATAYIFDSTARVVAKISWTAGGANEISWDGKNSFSEIIGDGVYLYRVVDASNKLLGKGKILVINK